jgi:hypothetical protein
MLTQKKKAAFKELPIERLDEPIREKIRDGSGTGTTG